MLDGSDFLIGIKVKSTGRAAILRRPIVCSFRKRMVQMIWILMSHISKRSLSRIRFSLLHYVAILSQIQICNLTRLHYDTLVQIDRFWHVTDVILEIIVHLESVIGQMTILVLILRAKTTHLFFDVHL